MPTKAEMLEQKSKDVLLSLADKNNIAGAKKSMKKSELVDVLAKSTKVKKADLQ